MRLVLIAALLMPLALVRGCGCEGTNTSPPAPASGDEAKARLNAARAISDMSQRDAALAQVAVDAGAGGDATVAGEAVGGMSDMLRRDAAIEQAALALSKAGRRADATELAKRISDLGHRDAALAKLAKGEEK
jgi:hypothetical protein